MNKIFEQLHKQIIPILVINDLSKIDRLCQYMVDNNIFSCEVTYRTNCANDAIQYISQHYPQILVGAGTILTKTNVDNAIKNGAKFLVSPGLNEDIVKYCGNLNIPHIPGVETASEIEKAMSLGLDFVKFFPSEAIGGTTKLKALASPYYNIKFMPTGGITTDNVNNYFALNCVWCVGGSFVIPKELQ